MLFLLLLYAQVRAYADVFVHVHVLVVGGQLLSSGVAAIPVVFVDLV